MKAYHLGFWTPGTKLQHNQHFFGLASKGFATASCWVEPYTAIHSYWKETLKGTVFSCGYEMVLNSLKDCGFIPSTCIVFFRKSFGVEFFIKRFRELLPNVPIIGEGDAVGWGGKHGDLTDRAFQTSFEKARSIASDLLNKTTTNIASRIHFSKAAIPVIVFNPLSWERTDLVKFTLDVEGNEQNIFRLIDVKGIEIPYQLIDEHNIVGNKDEVVTFLFVAEHVPLVGYKTYYIEKGKPATYSNNSTISGTGYENSFYKVEFADGGIKSLFDKELSTSLLKMDKFLGGEMFTMQSVGNGAGEFTDVQQPTMEGFEKLSSYHQPWALVSSGTIRDVYQFTKEINHVTVEQQVILYKTIKRIDVHVELKGFDGERYREFRLAFPVNQIKSEVSYEVPMGVVRVGQDEIAGAKGFSKESQIYGTLCVQVHPCEVQDWFSASDGKTGITISSDVAVFDWIDPTSNPAGYAILQPVLLASRKSCHGEGNYFLQPGDRSYNFSVYSHAGDWKNGYRLGTQSNQPLKAITVKPGIDNGAMAETMSFISVENKNLVLSSIKKCDDDKQVIVRCYDMEGKDSVAKISVYKPFQKAELTNLIEEEGKINSGKWQRSCSQSGASCYRDD